MLAIGLEFFVQLVEGILQLRIHLRHFFLRAHQQWEYLIFNYILQQWNLKK